MRVKCGDWFFGRAAGGGAEVADGRCDDEPSRNVGSVRVGFFGGGGVGVLVGEPVVFAPFDEVQLLGVVGVGAVADAEEFLPVVPGEAPGVADAAGEYFDLGHVARWVDTPDGGGVVGLTTFPVDGVVFKNAAIHFTAVGAGTAADVNHPVGPLGDVTDPMVVIAEAPRIAGAEPRSHFLGDAGGTEWLRAENDDAVDVVRLLGDALVGDEVEAFLRIDRHPENAEVAGRQFGVVFGGEDAGKVSGGGFEAVKIAGIGEHENPIHAG